MTPAKIIALIRSGDLPAINVGMGSKKPRFLIGPDDIAVFENRRRVQPAPAASPRRKRTESKPAGWINYSQTMLEKANCGRD